MAGAERVQHTAEPKQIAASVDRFAANLFGRHVVRRAGMKAAASQTGVVVGSGQTKIGQQRSIDAFIQQDIRWLYVAMDQSLSMRGSESFGGLHADAENFANVERSVAIDSLLQRSASNVLHHQKRRLLRIIACFDVVNRHDVIIDDCCCRASFASKPIPCRSTLAR